MKDDNKNNNILSSSILFNEIIMKHRKLKIL